MRLIRSNREFAPNVGTVIELATEIALEQAGVSLPSAEDAWAIVIGQVRARGLAAGAGPEITGNPIIAKAVDAMGWECLCDADSENIGVIRAQFLRLYGAYREQTRERAVTAISSGKPIERLEVRPLRQIEGGKR